MRGEEHARAFTGRHTQRSHIGRLDDLVVVRVSPKAPGYGAGETASFTMSTASAQPSCEGAGPKLC
jgi:hypothetical protein